MSLIDDVQRPTTEMQPRPQILALARSMEYKLRMNDHKRSWETYGKPEAYWFLIKLREEVQELEHAMLRGTASDIAMECADVANFALFVHDLVLREGAIGNP